MNPKERLLTSLWLEEPDRIPLDLYIGFNPLSPESWPKNSTLLDLTDPKLGRLGELVRNKCDPLIAGGLGIKHNFFYTSYPVKITTEQCVEGNMEVVRTAVETPKGPLTQVYRRPRGVTWSGRRSKAFVESDEELERFLSIPYKMVEPDTDPFIRLTRKVGDRGLVHSSISEPIRLVWSLMGQRRLSLTYFRNKDSILALEDLLYKRVCDYLDNVLRKGVRFFLVGGPEFVTPPLFGPHHFQDMVVKYERGIAKLVHDYDGLAWVHCHGSIGAVLDHFVSTGMDGLHPIDTPPIGDTPLGEAKRKMDGKMCIIGGMQIGDIYTDHKRVMEKKVREAIETCGPDGLILYPSATPYTPIPDDAMENYEAIVKTARAFGAVSY